MKRSGTIRSLAGMGVLVVAGCVHSNPAEIGVAPKGITVAALSTPQLDIPKPNVHTDGGVVTVSGRVHRQPDCTDTITGRIDIDILDADLKTITWLPALLTPDPVPTETNGEASYTVTYGMPLPPRATVRVHFVSKEKADQEDQTHTEQ